MTAKSNNERIRDLEDQLRAVHQQLRTLETGQLQAPLQVRFARTTEAESSGEADLIFLDPNPGNATPYTERAAAAQGTGYQSPVANMPNAADVNIVLAWYQGKYYRIDTAPPYYIFAVKLVSDGGGTDGDGTSSASWTYTVKDIDDNTLETAVDPGDSNHDYNRPNGKMEKATKGGAYYDDSGDLVIAFTNEKPPSEVCT